jgi:hypothetical protein
MLSSSRKTKKAGKMTQEREGHLLHISVSNQSLHQTAADVVISLDGEHIFQRVMMTNMQHTWEETTIPVVSGQHTLEISETRTRSREERVVNVDREMWLLITFHSPPPQIQVGIFDSQVGLI